MKKIYALLLMLFLSLDAFANISVEKNIVYYHDLAMVGTSLTKKGILKESPGIAVNYPCQFGGEPLVIYSTKIGNTQSISSKAIIYPLYIKNGYEASALQIPDYEQTSRLSNKYLITQTQNPADASISFSLKRMDNKSFFIDTSLFPIVNSTIAHDGKTQKYVSTIEILINNSNIPVAFTLYPFPNYSFDEAAGIFVYHRARQISNAISSWDQHEKWSNGTMGKHISQIYYRFSPEQSPDDPSFYNGFGFWVCGSDKTPKNSKHMQHTKNIYRQGLISAR